MARLTNAELLQRIAALEEENAALRQQAGADADATAPRATAAEPTTHRRSWAWTLLAVVLIVGCLLPWYTVGGDGGLPPETYQAFRYPQGLLAFLAGLGTLALVALPYAMGPRPVALDRGIVFGVLAGAAILGVVLWVPAVFDNVGGLRPDRAPGFWIAAVGAIMLGRAAFEISREPPRR